MADAHTGPIHLLVTDMVMPGLGGRGRPSGFPSANRGAKVLFMYGKRPETPSGRKARGKGGRKSWKCKVFETM